MRVTKTYICEARYVSSDDWISLAGGEFGDFDLARKYVERRDTSGLRYRVVERVVVEDTLWEVA